VLVKCVRSLSCLTLTLACIACGGEQNDACRLEVDAIGQPIVGGAASEPYLGVGIEASAIGSLRESEERPEAAICTATVIAQHWAITAAHCMALYRPLLRTSAGLTFAVADAFAHPDLDLGLLRLQSSCTSSLDAVPAIDIGGGDLSVGQRITLAGYGMSETSGVGELRFAVETVAELTETRLLVDGLGASGACHGDSGGPLLARGASGSIQMMGVLSGGSADCRGKDAYVRLRAAADWIREHVGEPLSRAGSGCGGMDETGRCFEDTAVFCDGDVVVANRCDAGTTCGWDRAAGGYRCAAGGSCDGDPWGRCVVDAAVACTAGTINRVQCDDLGLRCGIDAKTGRATCQ
jgi:hypothetical protein